MVVFVEVDAFHKRGSEKACLAKKSIHKSFPNRFCEMTLGQFANGANTVLRATTALSAVWVQG